MSRANPLVLFVFIALVLGALGGASVLQGALHVAKHEGDTLHLLQIVFRMAGGEWPHLDFMTPIGVMAFLPISGLVAAGLGIGAAILWSQVLVAAVLLLPTFWAAHTRFNGALAYGFAASVMVLALALVHGQSDQLVSISMHYNRWAWAVAYVVVVLAVLPPLRWANAGVDGALMGLGLAFLVLCKVTYFMAFAPVVVLALAMRQRWAALGAAVAVGLAALAVLTLFAGVGFWPAYLGDLAAVAGSDVRPQPGMPLASIIGAPAYLGGTLVLLAGVVFLRQAGEEHLGLMLLLLVPGFLYVTFQNFGNDPQWLVLAALLMLVPRAGPEADGAVHARLRVAAVAALAFAAPSMINLAYSPFRHLNVDPAKYTPMLTQMEGHGDLYGRVIRSNRVDGSIALDGPGSGLEDRQEIADRARTHTEFLGEVLPSCELSLGLIAWFETIVADLEASGFAGAKIYTADIFSGLWLFGDVPRLEGGSPWYYGGLPGIEDAEYVLVPLCPASEILRKQVLETVAERGITLAEVHRSGLYILTRVQAP